MPGNSGMSTLGAFNQRLACAKEHRSSCMDEAGRQMGQRTTEETSPVATNGGLVGAGSIAADEMLVPDERAGLSPAQQVEKKLLSLLKNALVPVSHIRTRDLAIYNRRR
jgi:hypothetical protein